MSESKTMNSGLDGMAVAAKELRKAILDMLPEGARADVSVKLDALDSGLSELREATKAAFGGKGPGGGGGAGGGKPPWMEGAEEDEEMKRKARKAAGEVDSSGETAQDFPLPVAANASSGATPPWSAEEQGKHDVTKSAEPAETSVPWPHDMAHPSFRKGEQVKPDPVRDWGKDPWATE